jgi:hypothetical protein
MYAPSIPGAYMVYRGTQIPLPYLPDPFASGVVMHVAPNGPAHVRHYDAPTWDTPVPIRLELHAATGMASHLAPGSGGTPFVVSLPPATILDVRIASTIPDSSLDTMWAWQNGGSASWTRLQAQHGQVSQITPNRTLRFVHAVLKPLDTASVTSATLNKFPNDSFSTISTGGIHSHSRSTGEVEVWAEWTEPQDLLPQAPQPAVPRKAFAYRMSIPYGFDDVTFPVTPDHQVVDPTTCQLTKGAPQARIDFGDTKYRLIQFRCTATTRYGEYYNPADVADTTKTTLPGALTATTYVVYSSARGPAPDIAYVVPTFGWTDASTTDHTRAGGGVRIYLNRPWFATGDGEILAVLVGNVTSGFVDVGDDVRPYVSEWGFDPVYEDAFNTGFFGNFPYTTLNAVRVISADAKAHPAVALTLAENPALTVLAIGHDIHYSPERDLWYTDVELDSAGAYTPFVRLAVARYQPNSIPKAGLELSTVVKIDCVQLAANRHATAVRAGMAVTLTVTGPSAANLYGKNASGDFANAGHLVMATVDFRPVGGSNLDWKVFQQAGSDLKVTLDANAPIGPGITSWSKTIANAPPTDSVNEYRVRIEEFEQFQGDGGTVGLRAVYLDTFPL